MAWRLNSFFGCARLDTGGRVIGGVQLVFSLTGIAIAILGIIGSVLTINNPRASPHDVYTAKTCIIVMIILIFSCVMNCIVAVFLIVGTKEQNPRYVLVWLIVTFITTMMSLLSNIAMFNIYSWVVFGISIYLYLCIYSLYVKIREEQPLLASEQTTYGAAV